MKNLREIFAASLNQPPIIEGKTKKIYQHINDPSLVFVVSKDDITAGDGAKHDVIVGKAIYANQTNYNVMKLLRKYGLRVAFEKQVDERTFMAKNCIMLPYEVVVRREAHGSFLKRNPELEKGHLFPELLVEFYLKTAGKKWKGYDLVKDDPYMKMFPDRIELYDPSKPLDQPFLTLRPEEVYDHPNEAALHYVMVDSAMATFEILEKAWAKLGRILVDFKVEFGLHDDRLFLSDVIDNDSWRLLQDGNYIDKQVYRDGGDINEVTAKYALVAELTDQFFPI